jgi:hypothetical protein
MNNQLTIKTLNRSIKKNKRIIVQIKETKSYWVKRYKKISKEQNQFTKLYKSCGDSAEGKILSDILKLSFVIFTIFNITSQFVFICTPKKHYATKANFLQKNPQKTLTKFYLRFLIVNYLYTP